MPASDEVAWLRARVAELEELNARLREAAAARDELAAAQLAVRDAQIAALAAQVEDLRRRLDKDSSTSLKPPSSDSPYTKKPRDRSLRGRSGRRPGKQPGAQSSTLTQSPDPGDTVLCGPAACGCCGHDLTGEPVLGTPHDAGAIRRRFRHIDFAPDPSVLTAWLQSHQLGAIADHAADRLIALNEQLGQLLDADRLIGHTYLMREDLGESGLDGVWEEDIEPVLHEHLFTQREEIAKLRDLFLAPA